MAGSWLMASVCIDRISVMRSTILPWCGSSSLSSMPDWPCLWNWKIERATGSDDCPDVMPVMRWPWRMESGSSVP